jgi:hypothetical protein
VLATPHALIYDMPMVLAGKALFIEECLEEGPSFSLGTVAVLALALTSPLLMMLKKEGSGIAASALSLLLLFGTILLHQQDRKDIGRTSAHQGQTLSVSRPVARKAVTKLRDTE